MDQGRPFDELGEEARDTRRVGDGDVADATDERMAEILRSKSSVPELRRALAAENTAESSDILARLNALAFVHDAVGDVEQLPTRIGEYEIKGLLGRGGMGTVYLGWQAELEREVALKVLSPQFSSDPTMRKRFRAEARATAALHHRHIVPIYDYGEAQGMLFFAMERVDGSSLDKHIAGARRLKKVPMAPLEAARRFAGVADALGLAHRRRLLHRDVKPGNILVASDGTLALTDFGLAKALDQASVHLTSKDGGFLGTLHYASPEQALGGELGPASDLYALGITIFEAVTGDLPRSGKTTEALLQSILHGTPRRLRDALPRPPRDLDAVLEKLLARLPGDRYQDGEALARDLQRIADGEPVHIRRLPLHVRLWRRARKNPVLSGAIAAAVVLLLATVTLLSVLRREKGQSLVSRHQNNLVAITNDIGGEAGPAWGPSHLLQALVGCECAVVPPSKEVIASLDRADRELPGDQQVLALRHAYCDDPLPVAGSLLKEGRGHEARLLFDQAIEDAIVERASGDLAVGVRLYWLYLGRGIANLTAAVARPNEARIDLALASYLRPGALFPRTLLAVLDLAQANDVELAAQRLERDLAAAAADRVRTAAQLLWAIAGLQPPGAANVMDFDLPFGKRRVLHTLAGRLVGDPPADLREAGDSTGLCATIADGVQKAMQRLGEPAVLHDLAEQSRGLIDRCVDTESPLQGWRAVVQLLEQPTQRGELTDRDGRPMSPILQLAAWNGLLRLSPPQHMVQLWLPRFEDLRRSHPGMPGLARIAAQLHTLAQTAEAKDLLDQWVVEAEGDPAAHLWRLRQRLRSGAVEAALDDAMVAVQESVVRDATLRAVVACCTTEAAALPGATRESVRAMAQQFRSLLGDGHGAAGGPR